jgi:hypothetical protein
VMPGTSAGTNVLLNSDTRSDSMGLSGNDHLALESCLFGDWSAAVRLVGVSLRIRRLGVRVPPSAPKAQVRRDLTVFGFR